MCLNEEYSPKIENKFPQELQCKQGLISSKSIVLCDGISLWENCSFGAKYLGYEHF